MPTPVVVRSTSALGFEAPVTVRTFKFQFPGELSTKSTGCENTTVIVPPTGLNVADCGNGASGPNRKRRRDGVATVSGPHIPNVIWKNNISRGGNRSVISNHDFIRRCPASRGQFDRPDIGLNAGQTADHDRPIES